MPALFLYEPRMLVRSVVISTLEEENIAVQLHQSQRTLFESICGCQRDKKILLVGIGGAGQELADILRLIRKMKTMKVKVIAWVPPGYPCMLRLLNALHTSQVLMEDELDTTLSQAVKDQLENKTQFNRQAGGLRRLRTITQTELEILLQFSFGMSSKEMADQRRCSYKTIFSWKHNICEGLILDTHAQWLEMLTELSTLTSLYQPG